jgi:cytochrome c biogenesis protein CcmG/thiol:disulfide interchange protein DsbE
MSTRTQVMRGTAIAIAAVTLAALLSGPVQAGAAPAPTFTLERLNGHSLSLGEFKGSPIILLFWAPW